MADRRRRVRFEIVGRLPGAVATEAPVHLEDLGLGGVLVRAAWPLTLDSTHTIRLGSSHEFSTLQARVRHVRRAVPTDDYLIGLEFVDVEPDTRERLHRIVGHNTPPAPAMSQ